MATPPPTEKKRSARSPADEDQVAKKARSDDPDKGPAFSDIMGTDMLDIYVGMGTEKKLFRVHEKILRDKVPYFDKMLSNGFQESIDKKIELPEDHVNSFDILLLWVYTSNIQPFSWILNSANGSDMKWDVFKVYELADKLCLEELMDEVTSTYIDASEKQDILPSITSIGEDCSKLSAHMGLKKYMVLCLDYYLNGMSRESNYYGSGIEEFVDLLSVNRELFLEHMQLVHQRPTGQLAPDPRKMPRCTFHQHDAGVECPLKKGSSQRTS
ncbi:uncharacterized protein LY89DRAFT_789980 [Mollisia scopiformis]|uniref:BTB domain-containing protein n=1 Tax=Mollisia scopiformis TaxID=149040 RepID=A0A132B483_MOLSC|nr:uncharacterized protein LY89DRAFT_789980 [Mollisia scopiformis]KUJ07196.1 hypothetical protein LY89DRAFT_789980 [Mollisia scopiformis]